ncbi:MAG TPA: hypothetical protein VG013_17660 [Gemmataceae bacterium]|jgi:hypothetical protein|nr:hypothetical protein [Gemmataceae bacterium]
MSADDLLARCRALGIDLSAGPGGALAWESDGDPPADALADLAGHKAELLALLASSTVPATVNLPNPPPDASAWDLDPDQYAAWEERVCIMHFDGRLPWREAEALALADILSRSAPRDDTRDGAV